LVDPTGNDLKETDPWMALEFFRIEALLRAEKVWKLCEKHLPSYKFGDASTDKLFLEYGVVTGWQVLAQAHHFLIRRKSDQRFSKLQVIDYGNPSGVLHLNELINHPPPQLTLGKGKNNGKSTEQVQKRCLVRAIGSMLEKEAGDPQAIYLRIDPSYPRHTILKKIESLLKTPQVSDRGGLQEFRLMSKDFRVVIPRHSRRRPPIVDVLSWLKYLRCYDLHAYEGLGASKIAQQIYPTKYERSKGLARDLVKKAVKRVKRLITLAQARNWPPSKL
jgi:hypothetical protein